MAILRIGEDAYGVPIAREIEDTGKRKVLVAAIYAALDRRVHFESVRRAGEAGELAQRHIHSVRLPRHSRAC